MAATSFFFVYTSQLNTFIKVYERVSTGTVSIMLQLNVFSKCQGEQ